MTTRLAPALRRAAAALALALAWLPAAAQVTIAVNSTAQEVTLAQPTGVANGNCTLGEAILAANARNVVDGCNGTSAAGTMVTLDLQAGTYDFAQVGQNVAVIGTSTSPFALPGLSQPTTIRGNNAALRRSPAAGTPSMGLIALTTDGMVFRAAALRLEGGVRGLSANGLPAGTIATTQIALTEFRLTDVVIARPQGLAFSVPVTTLARLERVSFTGVDLRTTRSSVSGTGTSAVVFEVIDSEFADGRGGFSIQPGIEHASASVLVSGSRFLRNRGFSGAGLRISSGQPGLLVTLAGNQFIDNTGSSGGGVEIQLASDGAPSLVETSGNLFRGNVATANGGALRINGGNPLGYRFSSVGDTFEGNAGTDGGAMRIDGTLNQPILIERATFRDNSANSGAAVAFGATHVAIPRVAMRITRSTFTGNADTAGTANLVGVFGTGHRVQIDNSTLDGNFASARLVLGGNGDSSLDAEALTITRNTARFAIDAPTGGATLRNTVVAENFLVGACTAAQGGTITNAGGLFVQDPSCGVAARTEAARLGPLAANDGSTLNRLPLAGSPLLGAGVAPVLEPLFDQRGLPRVQFGATDIGAVESNSPVIFLSGFEPAD
jgi:hypothetical protein